jgi:hypothetical protein
MRSSIVGVAALLVSACLVASAQVNNGFETVRIPTALSPRCVNSKTDEITLSVYRVTVEKTGGFFTSDNQAGIAVVSTVNADGQPPAKTPSVNVVSISQEHKGQVFLPLEYPIASRLVLSQTGTDTKVAETKNMLLEMYLEKTRGANSFGTFLTTAGKVLGKLSIPANPYLTATNTFINFANETIQNETKDAGAKLFATVTLQFADRDYKDVRSCPEGDTVTGAIAVLAATGSGGANLLTLGNLDQRFCWRYSTASTYEIQYASKPASGCSNVSEAQWAEPSNDYVMLLLSAAVVLPSTPAPKVGTFETAESEVSDYERASRRVDDLRNARKLCDSLKVPRKLCGVN